MDLFFSQLQSASQTCTVSEVAEDKKMKLADDICHELTLFNPLPTTVYSAVYSQFISYL